MKKLAAIILLILNYSFVAAQTNKTIVAETAAPKLIESTGINFGLNETEYNKISKQLSVNPNFITIKRKPAQLTPTAVYGLNLVIQGKNLGWILDGDETSGITLYADLNADGDLTNDIPLKFKKSGAKYVYEIRKKLVETINNRRQRYSYIAKLEAVKSIPPGKKDERIGLIISDATARKGTLNVNNRQIAFELFGWNGHFNDETNSLYFDLDGDGRLDKETRYSLEAYKVKDKYVNINGKSYEFTVNRYGDNLTLKSLSVKLPDRTDLRVGNLAPEFSFKDLNGNQRRLSDYRGKIVLIDIWGLWCAPCVAEAPQLATAYQKLKDKGFEILSLDKGDTIENLQKFINEKQMNWTHSQADEKFLQLYRVDRYPTYFLLDKEGKIISNTMRPGEEMYKKIEQMLETGWII